MIVKLNETGDFVFNWDEIAIPEEIKSRQDIKEKVFNDLQREFQIAGNVDTKLLFEINRYALSRIKYYLGVK